MSKRYKRYKRYTFLSKILEGLKGFLAVKDGISELHTAAVGFQLERQTIDCKNQEWVVCTFIYVELKTNIRDSLQWDIHIASNTIVADNQQILLHNVIRLQLLTYSAYTDGHKDDTKKQK